MWHLHCLCRTSHLLMLPLSGTKFLLHHAQWRKHENRNNNMPPNCKASPVCMTGFSPEESTTQLTHSQWTVWCRMHCNFPKTWGWSGIEWRNHPPREAGYTVTALACDTHWWHHPTTNTTHELHWTPPASHKHAVKQNLWLQQCQATDGILSWYLFLSHQINMAMTHYTGAPPRVPWPHIGLGLEVYSRQQTGHYWGPSWGRASRGPVHSNQGWSSLSRTRKHKDPSCFYCASPHWK